MLLNPRSPSPLVHVNACQHRNHAPAALRRETNLCLDRCWVRIPMENLAAFNIESDWILFGFQTPEELIVPQSLEDALPDGQTVTSYLRSWVALELVLSS